MSPRYPVLGTDSPSPDALAACADGALTIQAAVDFSGVPRSSIYELLNSGDLPSIRVGRRRLIPKRALVEFLARHFEGA